MRKPRILLADEHELVLAGLRALLEPHYDLVATTNDGLSAVSTRDPPTMSHSEWHRAKQVTAPHVILESPSVKRMIERDRIKVLSGRSLWRTISQVRRNLVQDFLAVVLDDPRFVLGESSIRPYVKQQPLAPTGEGTKCFGLLHNYPPVIT